MCYQCSKHITDCLFGKFIIKDFNDEPHFPIKRILISSRIQMNKLFKNNDKIKISICDKSIHKAIRITVDIHQTNKRLFVKVQPKNTCLPFLDLPQSDIIAFSIITFHIYKIMVTKWKHGIGPNDLITFNK